MNGPTSLQDTHLDGVGGKKMLTQRTSLLFLPRFFCTSAKLRWPFCCSPSLRTVSSRLCSSRTSLRLFFFFPDEFCFHFLLFSFSSTFSFICFISPLFLFWPQARWHEKVRSIVASHVCVGQMINGWTWTSFVLSFARWVGVCLFPSSLPFFSQLQETNLKFLFPFSV